MTYRLSVLAEELSANAPQVVSIRARSERRVRAPTRGTFDEFLSDLVGILPFSSDLLFKELGQSTYIKPPKRIPMFTLSRIPSKS